MAESIDFDLNVKKNQLNSALDDGARKASKLGDTLNTALAVFGGNLITKGFDAFTDSLGSLVDFASDSVKAAADQEVAINNLNNALSRAGNFSKEASAGLVDFSTALQATTVFEDDAVQGSLALLQSLTKLNADGLKQGVSAAADFATVLGVDLETATRLVAKAAEGNTEAFKRYGVEIKKGATDSESFANTITALNTQFGGAAQSQLNTYSGSVKSLSNAYSDLKEPIGDVIVKNPVVIALINEVKSAVNSLNENLSANKNEYISLVTDGILYAVAGVKTLFDAFDGLTVVFKASISVIKGIAPAIALGLIEPLRVAFDAIKAVITSIPILGAQFEVLKNPLDGISKSLREDLTGALNDFTTAADPNLFRDLSDGADIFANTLIASSEKIALSTEISNGANEERKKNEDDTNADVLAKRTQFGIDIATLNQQIADDQLTQDANRLAISEAEGVARQEAQIGAIYEQKARESEAVLAGELAKNMAITDAQTKALADQKAYAAKKLADQKANGEKEAALDKLVSQTKVQNTKDTFSLIAGLSSSNNKTLAGIGKAAGVTQIAIDTPVAISKALAAFPPPFNFVAAGLVGAAMAAQAARIAGVQFANGGVVGQFQGATNGPDNRTATIRDGEMILNAEQQKNLFESINSGSIGGSGNIIVQIDGREIAKAVRTQVQKGFQLA